MAKIAESPDQVLILAEAIGIEAEENTLGSFRLGGFIKYGVKHLYFYVGSSFANIA